jgi:hypothetical protein
LLSSHSCVLTLARPHHAPSDHPFLAGLAQAPRHPGSGPPAALPMTNGAHGLSSSPLFELRHRVKAAVGRHRHRHLACCFLPAFALITGGPTGQARRSCLWNGKRIYARRGWRGQMRGSGARRTCSGGCRIERRSRAGPLGGFPTRNATWKSNDLARGQASSPPPPTGSR